MANVPTVAHSETIPAGTNYIREGDDRIREFKKQVREVIGVDHKMDSAGQGATWGMHKWVTFIEAADIGSGAAGLPILGAQTVTKPELCYTDEDDNDVILTNEGASIATETPDDSAPTDDEGIANKKYVDGHGTVQVVNVQDGAVDTGATVMVLDDTIPQIDEGDEYMTLAITPTNALNLLKIDVMWNGACANNGNFVLGLFQDATADALACTAQITHSDYVNGIMVLTLSHYMVAGTAVETTFRVRAGQTAAGTTTFNGKSGGRQYGGVLASSITITEIKV